MPTHRLHSAHDAPTTSPHSKRQVRVRSPARTARDRSLTASTPFAVTNLEGVVLELQDSCRQTKSELSELKQENSRLRTEITHKDSLLKMYQIQQQQQQRKLDREPQEDYAMSSYAPIRTPPVTVNTSIAPGPSNQYGDDPLRYASAGDASGSVPVQSPYGPGYPQRSPALGYAHMANAPDDSQLRYAAYPAYPLDANGRDSAWAAPGTAVSESSTMDSSSSAHSPTFIESPTLTNSDLAYAGRFAVVDDQKLPLNQLATGPYLFTPSRSLSPAPSSVSSSVSSSSIAPNSYQFTFPEGSALQDRTDFLRRAHAPELTLHGGTADISSITAAHANAFRMGGRTSASAAAAAGERSVHALNAYSRTENASFERESDNESGSYTYSSQTKSRPLSRMSRSPSPGPPPICGTLAVIKAQTFGALRRTRGRTKKSSESAARAAMEALQARGIGMGVPMPNSAKRPRLRDGDGDLLI